MLLNRSEDASSPPTRGRELELSRRGHGRDQALRRPLRGGVSWNEFNIDGLLRGDCRPLRGGVSWNASIYGSLQGVFGSPPTRGRELERRRPGGDLRHGLVAPYAGA